MANKKKKQAAEGLDRPKRANRKNKRLSYCQKVAVTAGGLALMPAVSEAAIIHVTGSPVSLAMSAANGSTVTWDVDGAAGHDFELFRSGSSTTGSIHLASRSISSSGPALNGRGLVGPTFYTDNVQALPQSFNVGPTLANSYVWGSAPYRYRNAMGTSSTYPGGPTYFIGYDFNYGFNIGDNFFGFRFLDGAAATHYGWANINFDTANGIVTISEWAYQSTADTPIHIADTADSGGAIVPEPKTSTLALLGLGAAGVLSWRSRKKKKRATQANEG